MMHTIKHARLAALALGACLTLTACGGGNDAEDAGAVDTAGGAVANAPVTGGAGTGSMEATDEPKSDGDIMTMISLSNNAEVSASTLARTQASNAQVKAFATQMITEHTAMQKQGQQIGKAMGAEGTGTEASADKKDMNMDNLGDMKDKKGADFDKAYMDVMVQSHEKTLAELRSYESRAQHAELKAMITGAIPKVEAHLQKAQQIRQQLGS